MGLKCGHKVTHSINSISLDELVAVLTSCSVNPEYDGTKQLTIDIDASWIARRSLRVPDNDKAAYLVRLCRVFTAKGIDVVIVCDGTKRHHSKRATITRAANQYRDKYKLLHHQNSILNLSQALASQEMTTEERAQVESKIDNLKKEIRKSEVRTSSFFDVGNSYFNSIIAEVKKLTSNDQNTNGVAAGNIEVLQAAYQADTVIAYRRVKQLNDAVLGSDSDQAYLCEWDNTEKILKVLNVPTTSPRLLRSKTPVFESIDSAKVRSLIAVGIGCDVYESGIPGLGAGKIYKFIQSLQQKQELAVDQYYSLILNDFVSVYLKNKEKTKNEEYINADDIKTMINIFVESLMYEPANFLDANQNSAETIEQEQQRCNTSLYVDDSPVVLHPYNKEFASPADYTHISPPIDEDCPIINCCVGPGTGEHPFITTEGVVECSNCKHKLCPSCWFETLEDTDVGSSVHKYCYNCFTQTISDATSQVDVEHDGTNAVPLNQMLLALQEIGVTMSVREDDVADIIDAYTALISQKQQNEACETARMMEKITIPCESASYLKEMETVSTFEIRDGGNIIFNEENSLENIFDLLETMTELVNLKAINDNTSTLAQTSSTTYHVLPEMIISFAERAREGHGYRLKERTLRHALDAQSKCLVTGGGRGSIVMYQNKTALHIQHQVKASMKQDFYNVEVVFTKDTIIANKCTCKAGCSENDKVICVHVLPVLYQLTFLIFEGLAEHILIEMSAYFKSNNVLLQTMSSQQKNMLKRYIRNFRIATQKYKKGDDELTIEELLKLYDVGTEKVRFGPSVTPIDTNLLGPLRSIDLSSIKKKARQRIHRQQTTTIVEQEEEEEQNENEIQNTSTTVDNMSEDVLQVQQEQQQPAYANMIQLGNAFLHYLPIHETDTIDSFHENILNLQSTVGFRLLELRAQSIKIGGTKSSIDRSLAEKVKSLIEKANCELRTSIATTFDDADKENNGCFGNSPLQVNNNAGEIYDVASTTNLPEQAQTTIDDIVLPNTANKTKDFKYNGRKRYKCCACERTAVKNPEALFHKVPLTEQRELVRTDGDKKRFSYYKRKQIRKLFLKRFKLPIQENEKKHLVFCDKHEIVRENIKVSWIDKNKKPQQTEAFINVPKDPSKKYVSTRAQLTNTWMPGSLQRASKKVMEAKEVKREIQKCNLLCHYHGCTSRFSNKQLFFRFLPSIPSNEPKKSADAGRCDLALLRYAVRKSYRMEVLGRMGLPTSDTMNNRQICSKHEIVSIHKNVCWKDRLNNLLSVDVMMNVPYCSHIETTNTIAAEPNIDFGAESTTLSSRRSLRSENKTDNAMQNLEDRSASPTVLTRDNIVEKHGEEGVAAIESLCSLLKIDASNICLLTGGFSQVSKSIPTPVLNSIENLPSTSIDYSSIPTKSNAAGESSKKLSFCYDAKKAISNIEINNPSTQPLKNLSNIQKFYSKKKKKRKRNVSYSNETAIKLCDVSDKLIKKTTSFNSVHHMMYFLSTLCLDGDIKTIEATTTRLTWFEEWFAFFRILWGRGTDRWFDAEEIFKASERTLRTIFINKLKIVMKARSVWPMFVTMEEDFALRSEKWNASYENKQIIMWDNTDIPLVKPSDAMNQRLTWSNYYASNVGKGSIFIQLCGWMGTHEIWCGAVSNTDYFTRSGILELQNNFVDKYNSCTADVPWTNILDKGYRVTKVAWKNGKQLVLQPVFMRSDRKFGSRDVLKTAQVATDRSGNERAVRLSKKSGFVSNGLRNNESVKRLCDAWLCWSFQCNFLYQPVH